MKQLLLSMIMVSAGMAQAHPGHGAQGAGHQMSWVLVAGIVLVLGAVMIKQMKRRG